MQALETRPRIRLSQICLSILLAKDEVGVCAYCPELDLIVQSQATETAIDDMIEESKEYAAEYLAEIDLYSNSPNRAHHLPYVKMIADCKDDWELKEMFEIRYGRLQF
ncbi:MAG: hypothetical protein V2A53_03960 [bacterium]